MSTSSTTATPAVAPPFTVHRRQWVSVAALADELGVDRSTIYRWIDRGWVKAYRVGRGLPIDRADLDGVIAQRTRPVGR